MRSLRTALLVLVTLLVSGVFGQVVRGKFELPKPADWIVLYGTRGSQHFPIDSMLISAEGRFEFKHRTHPPGFYQLGINGDDRIDLVIDPSEPVIELSFRGTPLQRNVDVLRSDENQRLWAYKLRSREGQAAMNALQDQRGAASPLDTALLRELERKEGTVRHGLVSTLDSLIGVAPGGQFAFAVNADRRLDAATFSGPPAIRAAFNFSDPRLLRSSAFSKAVLLYLQSTPFTDEFALHRASDTLLTAASRDTACWAYVRWQLLDMFTTYGPDDAAQYLVDHYVVGPGALLPPDASLLRMASEQLRLVMGAPAPEMILVTPGASDTLLLSEVLPQHAFTALFFYSSTCDHCHAQMPGLSKLVSELDPTFFQLIGIALDVTEEEFRGTLQEEKINWPCYSELKAWGAQGPKDYNVKATPTLFVLDRQGLIRAKPLDHQELRGFLAAQQK